MDHQQHIYYTDVTLGLIKRIHSLGKRASWSSLHLPLNDKILTNEKTSLIEYENPDQ